MHDITLEWYRGKWYARWRDRSGNRRRRALGTVDKSLAQTRLGTLKRELSAASQGHTSNVRELYLAYTEDRRPEIEPESLERIGNALKRLDPTFGSLKPEDITKDVCQGYIAMRRKDGVSDGTIHTEMTYLRSALNCAVRNSWLTVAPFITVPKRGEPRHGHLNKAQARRVVNAADAPHLKLFILLALGTAGRASAILQLTWDRVDLERRTIALHDPFTQRTRKGRATVPINDMVYAALEEAQTGATSRYVVEWGGRQVKSVKKGVAAAARRSGVKCSPHMFRHTAAVWMAENRTPMSEIAQYLGHNDSRTTERVYARYSPEYLRDAAKALEL